MSISAFSGFGQCHTDLASGWKFKDRERQACGQALVTYPSSFLVVPDQIRSYRKGSAAGARPHSAGIARHIGCLPLNYHLSCYQGRIASAGYPFVYLLQATRQRRVARPSTRKRKQVRSLRHRCRLLRVIGPYRTPAWTFDSTSDCGPKLAPHPITVQGRRSGAELHPRVQLCARATPSPRSARRRAGRSRRRALAAP
jgi:hypothetical protein